MSENAVSTMMSIKILFSIPYRMLGLLDSAAWAAPAPGNASAGDTAESLVKSSSETGGEGRNLKLTRKHSGQQTNHAWNTNS